MCDILNAIIAAGGTTAYQVPFSPETLRAMYIDAPSLVACHVAEADQLLGFQALWWPTDAAHPFPSGWTYIATFARRGITQRGVGSALFTATRAAAEAAGSSVIDATIRADNTGGLAYYARQGFVDYERLVAVPLNDGTPVDRIRKRFDLQVPVLSSGSSRSAYQ